jgi:hypothetical protein
MKLENDRKRIVLLRHKVIMSSNDQKEYVRLTEQYPDNERYESDIYMELNNLGFLKYTGKDSYQDGDWHNEQEYSTDLYITTVLGEQSLLTSFESEFSHKRFDRRGKIAEIIGYWIAGILGLIGIFTFLYQLIKGSGK